MTEVSDSPSEISPPEASPAPESISAPPAPDKPWPAVSALLMTWLKPATAARHLLHVGLFQAFEIHLVSGVILFFGASTITAAVEGDSPLELWGEMAKSFERYPSEFLFGLSIFCGVLEGMSIALALLLTPWGARDEKLRSSLYRAMRTVWLQSMHFVMATLLLISLILCYENMHRWGWGPGFNWSDRPWYYRHRSEILAYCAFALYGWTLWGMLRAAGARPAVPPPDQQTCQGCGYNLTGAAAEGLCPECGEPVVASIGPDARPGVAWERRGHLLTSHPAWWETSGQTLRAPARFGRDLRLYSPPGGHRLFLSISMLAAGAAGCLGAGCWLLGFVSAHEPYYDMFEDFFWLTAPMTGIFTGLSVLVISLLFAGVLGCIFSFGIGRNAMPAATRCACYLSGCLVFWVLANVPLAYMFGRAPGIRLFESVAHRLRIDPEAVALLAWGLLNLAGLWVYLRLFWRMLKGARYANR